MAEHDPRNDHEGTEPQSAGGSAFKHHGGEQHEGPNGLVVGDHGNQMRPSDSASPESAYILRVAKASK